MDADKNPNCAVAMDPRQPTQEAMDGSPAWFKNEFIEIKFQCGPKQAVGINGAQIDEILGILIQRLEGFQNGRFACRENALVITKLEEALHWIQHRTADRQKRGVEGYNSR